MSNQESLKKAQYEWEFGISFLSKDEALAERLSKELKKYVTTYFYRDEERKQAFQNSADLYSTIFNHKIRVAIVLYRDGYGKKGVTVIEKNAILEILKDDNRGYENIFLVKIDGTTPSWYSSQIYEKYNESKFQSLIAILLFQLRKVGGEIKNLTPLERTQLVAEQEKFRRERDIYLYTPNGEALKNAKLEYNKIVEIFCDTFNEHSKIMDLGCTINPLNDSFPNTGSARCSFSSSTHDYCAVIGWKTDYNYSLTGNKLSIYVGKMFNARRDDLNRIANHKFFFTINKENETGWAKMNEPDSFFTSKQIIDIIYDEFVGIAEEMTEISYNKKHQSTHYNYSI